MSTSADVSAQGAAAAADRPPSRRPRRRRWLRTLALLVCLAGAIGGSVAWRWFDDHILAPLPSDLSDYRRYRPASACTIHDAAGREVDRFFVERRFWSPIDELPEVVWKAFVSAEDRRFLLHPGVDVLGILRALWINLQAGDRSQGGSTITQQVVKNLIVGGERTYTRKLREAVLAYRLEGTLSKPQILELYVNLIPLGAGNLGVEAAARDYFGRSARTLDAGQAALLAGLAPAPSRLSPRVDVDAARARRDLVLQAMVRDGVLTRAEGEAFSTQPVLQPPPRDARAGQTGAAYFTAVRRQVRQRYGEAQAAAAGLEVHTPLDMEVQALAEAAVRDAAAAVEARQVKTPPALPVEGAAVVVENATGHVLALVGGREATLEGFVRATQAHRQPGSAFKPFVYAAALAAGRTQLDRVLDAPIALRDGAGRWWRPRNYDDEYAGSVTLRRALAKSYNTAALRLYLEVGGDRVAALARDFGLKAYIGREASAALGGIEVTPWEIAGAYAAIPRGGRSVELAVVSHVVDVQGARAEWPRAPVRQVLAPGAAYELADMLREVVRSGTARTAFRPDRDRAGKTGTTNDCVDAWFAGFDPRHTVVVWIGTDGHATLGDEETGGKAALPAWRPIMDALDGRGGADPRGRLPIPDEALVVRREGVWIGLRRSRVPDGVMPLLRPGLGEPLPPFPGNPHGAL